MVTRRGRAVIAFGVVVRNARPLRGLSWRGYAQRMPGTKTTLEILEEQIAICD